MSSTHEDALKSLRSMLLETKPSGGDGFEGLVAASLATLTGLTIRLAKSGLQLGRDASSRADVSDPFAIGLEAKRYRDEDIRLEALAGKAAVAAAQLEIDVWAVCTTSSVGDLTAREVSRQLEQSGISFLCLDWTPYSFPPLAAVLAAEPSTSLEWFKAHRPEVNPAELRSVMTAVRSHPGFEAQAEDIVRQLQASVAGLDALRRNASRWLRAQLENSAASQDSFGQVIRVADPEHPSTRRPSAEAKLADALATSVGTPTVVAVIGEEGTGKTWLVADWWVAQEQAPVLIMVSGRRASQLQDGDPVGSLARLLAEQDGEQDHRHVDAWRRRLARWRNGRHAAEFRFVLVLDGVNEHPSAPWGRIISQLSRVIHDLGGVLIVTSRPGFWEANVRPRLGNDRSVSRVLITEYSDQELAEALKPSGVSVTDLTPAVRAFVRNPRVCALAAHLFEKHSIQPDVLTINHLLLEYWRARLRERQDLVVHNVSDFEKLLRLHAGAWLRGSQQAFAHNDWADYSDIARRQFDRAESDATDIEEGRFLQPSADEIGSYQFRPDALPFALGLLICEELVGQHAQDTEHLGEVLDRMLAPVRGFDAIADIVAAAVGIACLSAKFPVKVTRALIPTWFELQNKTPASLDSMRAYLLVQPEPFLDATEEGHADMRGGADGASLRNLLLQHRDDPRLRPKIDHRLHNWLARWSRHEPPAGADAVRDESRQANRTKFINEKLGALTLAERQAFEEFTFEVPRNDDGSLVRLAVLMLADRPIAPFTLALLGWSFVQWVAPTGNGDAEELAWVLRLNQLDAAALQETLHALVERFEPPASELARAILATMLRLVGDTASAAHADAIRPAETGVTWRRISQFCDTNPFDPDAEFPSNIANVRQLVSNLDIAEIWSFLGQTSAGHELELVTPALARFDPSTIVELLRRIIATAPDRAGMALRQLGWHLPDVAPLLDTQGVVAVTQALEHLLDHPESISAVDLAFVASYLFVSVAPELQAERQLEILHRFPSGPIFDMLIPALKPVRRAVLEQDIRLQSERRDLQKLARTLLFTTDYGSPFPDDVRAAIVNAFLSSDTTLAACAAHAVQLSNDPTLDDEVLTSLGTLGGLTSLKSDFWSLAVSSLIIRRKKQDLLEMLPVDALGWAALYLGESCVEVLTRRLGGMLEMLGQPLPVAPPNNLEITAYVDDDIRKRRYSAGPVTSGESTEPGEDLVRLLNDPAALVSREANLHAERTTQAREYMQALDDAHAAEMMAPPNVDALRLIVAAHPKRVEAWLRAATSASDNTLLRQLHNLAVALASAYADRDPELAGQVFCRFEKIPTVLNVLLGAERVPLPDYALFGTPATGLLTELRRRAFDSAYTDAELEELTVAAELGRDPSWLDDYVERLLASGNPGLQARGLTVAGLRFANAASDRSLAADWGGGFVGNATKFALKTYERAKWADEWLRKAASTQDPMEFWRFATLAEGVADVRIFRSFRELRRSGLLLRYGDAMEDQFEKRREDRSKKRKATLFGHKAPSQDLVALVTASAS